MSTVEIKTPGGRPMVLYALSPQCGALLMALLADVAAAAAVMAVDEGPFVGRANLLPFGVLGAVGGSFLKVMLAPPKVRTEERKLRQLAAEFFGAFFCGVCLMPMAIHYGGFPHDAYLAMGISFLLSTVAVGIIHGLSPAIERMGIRRSLRTMSDLLGADPEEADPETLRRRAELAADHQLLVKHDSDVLRRSQPPSDQDRQPPTSSIHES